MTKTKLSPFYKELLGEEANIFEKWFDEMDKEIEKNNTY